MTESQYNIFTVSRLRSHS